MNEPARGVAYARVWTAEKAPRAPGELADALMGRGFIPGIEGADGRRAPTEADAVLGLSLPPLRFLSLSSSRGGGCLVRVASPGDEPPPEDRLIQRQVPRPALVYLVEASGPSHSDRNLCEHLAEALMQMTGGVAQVGGRGTRGNRPVLYREPWLGSLRD